jgi:tetratricopeptide (TPR) repeat protein
LERLDYSIAARHYQQAIDVGTPNALPEGDLLLAYAGLALSLRFTGDFKGAATAFDHGIAIAERTYGHETRLYWAIASDRAQFLYDRGERVAALADFETLLKYLPKNQLSFHNAADMMEAAHVFRKYGYCLAIDGQGTKAVALLERARSLLQLTQTHLVDNALLESNLGNAYAAAGRDLEAGKAFTTSLNERVALHSPPRLLAVAHWRRGLFLLSKNDLDEAKMDLEETLRLSNGVASESATIAQAGLAEISALRGDARAADAHSDRAMSYLATLEGYYDVRLVAYVWQARARSLLLKGDTSGAREMAGNALRLGRKYYSASSPELARMEILARETVGEVIVRRPDSQP